MTRYRFLFLLLVLAMLTAAVAGFYLRAESSMSDVDMRAMFNPYNIKPTGLKPRFPPGSKCSPLTSLYASDFDVDGSKRSEPHSGVDGGRLGEDVLAPANGEIIAAWIGDWGWGDEGALLIRHSRENMNLEKGPRYYYSAFYHLDYSDVEDFRQGGKVERGNVLASVYRPGGRKFYMPEVHWEVYKVSGRRDNKIKWRVSHRTGRPYWYNKNAELTDPLSLLALENGIDSKKRVLITPFDPDRDYTGFKGFTYILPCRGVR